MTTHPEVPQATAREEAARIIMDSVVESMPRAQQESIRCFWDPRPVLDALLAATQGDGAPLIILGPEQAGALVHEHYTDVRTPFFVFHALPGPAVEPLFRAPFIEAQREEA